MPNHIQKLTSAGAFAVLAGSLASAQTASAPEVVSLDQVRVTATLRERPLQLVPVAVTVVDGARAEQANLNTLFAIASDVPALTFRTNSSNKDTTLLVRGIGTVTTSPGVEPSVSTVVDGVVLARPGQATLDLFDVQRIEVLRGPQGTLFGKNASAGVINIVTREPAAQLGGFVDASYFGGGDEYRLRVGASGEIAPDLARFSVNALYASYDGNVRNVFDGDTVNGFERSGARSKLVLTPTPAVKLTFAADYLESKADNPLVFVSLGTAGFPTGFTQPPAGLADALAPAVAGPENRTVNSNFRTRVDDLNWGLSGTAEIDVGDHTLTAITAYRVWENTQYQDGDRLSAPAVGLNQSHDKGILEISQFSQELRLASPTGTLLDYVAGLYFFGFDNDEVYRRDVLRILSGAPVDDFGRADYGTASRSYAAFGEGTVNVSDRFRVLAGLRVTRDELKYYHDRIASAAGVPGVAVANPPPYVGRGSTHETAVSGRAGLQFDVTATATTYATYSRGYKGPAYNVFFNHNQFQGAPLEPETSDSFEVGVKTTALDRRLVLNVAAFHSTYHDHQADFAGVVNGVFVTNLVNAGTVVTRGVELDAVARVTPALTLRAGLARIAARVDSFANPANNPAFAIDGKPLPFSPDWKATVGATHRTDLGSGYTLELATDFAWQSEVQYSLRQWPDTVQGDYGIWNGSLTLAHLPGRWRVTGHVKNILDKSYAAFLSQGAGGVGRIVPRDDRRYFGLTVRKEF